MVGGPVDFTGEYALNFSWKGRKKMYELMGVRTHMAFLQKLDDQAKTGTPDDVYEKIIYAGLIWKHPELKLEQKDGDPEGTVYVADIVEQYFQDGHDLVQFDEAIIDAFVEAGLMNREQVKFSREIKKIKSRDDIKKVLDMLDTAFEKAEIAATLKTTVTEGEDTGEAKT